MFLSPSQLDEIGFKTLGKDVLISDKASIYNPHLIEIGDYSRIDDFAILSPGTSLQIGRNVHIACYVSLIGKGIIIIDDFCGLSGKTSLYSSSDDYSGCFLTNPTVYKKYTSVCSETTHLKKHVLIGAHSVILPGSLLDEGSATGAQTLVNGYLKPWTIYGGTPCKILKERSKQLLDLEKAFLHERP